MPPQGALDLGIIIDPFFWTVLTIIFPIYVGGVLGGLIIEHLLMRLKDWGSDLGPPLGPAEFVSALAALHHRLFRRGLMASAIISAVAVVGAILLFLISNLDLKRYAPLAVAIVLASALAVVAPPWLLVYIYERSKLVRRQRK